VALTVGVLGCYSVLSEWMIRRRSYGALGRRNLLQGVGQVATQLGWGMTGAGPLGLLLGLGVGRLLAVGGLLSRGGLLRQPRPPLDVIRAVLRRFRRFPQVALPSALVNSAGLELPLLLVAALYGDTRAGLLGLAVRVIGGPSMILGQAVSQVFTGETSAALRGRRGSLGKSIRRSVVHMLAVGAVPAALLIAAGPALFGAVFGAEWVEAGEFARYLAVGYLAQFAVTPVSGTLWLLERQGRELGWVTFRLIMTAGAPLVCWALEAPISAAIIALSVGQVVSYLLLYQLCIQAAATSSGGTRSAGPSDGHAHGTT
jgi:O-antigen/teichoic acid export membrane protein